MRAPIIRASYDLLPGEIVADNFAGGGGASTGLEMAINRPVDIAINHDPEALAVHRANHPGARHFCENILEVDPREACGDRPVGVAWFSPDCKHHSKARGGKPRDNNIRALAWVVIRWAKLKRPRIIFVENVEEFEDWGPLDESGRPDRGRAGETFRQWLAELVALGYAVDYRQLVAADYGAPTSRKRFFLVARCDGRPIVWPEATHGEGRPEPWRPAADVIDWSLPCPSIFLSTEQGRRLRVRRPLKEPTLKRIARGIEKFLVDDPAPFVIKYHGGSAWRGQQLGEPLRTVDAANRFGLVTPYIVPTTHSGDSRVHAIGDPLRTVTGAHRGELALVAPFIVRHGHYSHRSGVGLRYVHGGPGMFRGQPISTPLGTVCATNDKHLVATFLTKYYGTSTGSPMHAPMPTVTANTKGGGHIAEVRAFLLKYYGTADAQPIGDPLHTVTAKSRFALVYVQGEPYRIVDIGMRMLQPHELFAAQGFPEDYDITPDFNGKPLTKTAQTRLAGNSVCPPVANALVSANARAA